MYEIYTAENDEHNMIMDNDGFSMYTGAEDHGTAEWLIDSYVNRYGDTIDLKQYNFTMWVTGMLNYPSKTQKDLIEKRLAELGVPEEKSVLLQHMLLSHHGQPEFGAAVLPQCAESELLYLIINVSHRNLKGKID